MKQTRLKKWGLIIFFCFILSTIMGCGEKEEKKDGVAGIVQELYASDYEFRKTEVRYMDLLDENGEITGNMGLLKTVYDGKVCSEPRENYMKVVEESQESAWTERYILEEDDKILMSTKNKEGELFSQELGKGFEYAWRYPYGYGKELNFVKDREEEINGRLCDVYKTEYQELVTVGEKDHLEATVEQEYYIDKEKKQVTLICTDLQDLYDKQAAASSYLRNDISLEKAVEQMKGKAKGAEDILEILNYNGDITITPIQSDEGSSS